MQFIDNKECESDESIIRKCIDELISEIEQVSEYRSRNSSPIKRYTYKCNYCVFNTKFKLHIVEHMLQEHQIYLMECPEPKCRKQFKDEWKLKRHLESNRDHSPLNKFKDFNEVMQQHVQITLYKPDFKCPCCDKSYETHAQWLQHLAKAHTDFNTNSHYICTQCAQVFRSNYKLKCHTFNVHKRQCSPSTPRTPKTKTMRNENEERMCHVCAKLFKGYKTFQRHIHSQHGINEYGEPLIECPVCERVFFNRKQIERHMHSHEIWVHDSCAKDNDSAKGDTRKSPIPDWRPTQSLLYCHECVECKCFYKSNKTLAKHKREAHHLKPVFRCLDDMCHLEFDSMLAYMDHAKLHTQKNIECGKCKAKFASKSSLRQHLKSVHYKPPAEPLSPPLSKPKELPETVEPPPQRHICYTCYKEFETSNSLHNHLATHTDMRLFVCGVCEHAFNTRKDLSRHAASHHDINRPAKICKICCMTFKTSFHLKRHELTRHTNIRPHKCTKCDMTFARKDKLKQHQAKHNDHPLFQCQLCGKGFYRKEHLKDHEIAKHSKQYPFKCENCSKGFVHCKDLHRHIRVRHLGFSLPPKASITSHEQKESFETMEPVESEKQLQENDSQMVVMMDETVVNKKEAVMKAPKRFLKSFKCEQCDKGFFYENHLKKHILSKHSSTPLYSCSHCKMGFSTQSTARSHVNNKHIEFGCTICTKSFRTRSHAQRHIVAVHGQEMRPTRLQTVHAEVVDLSEKNGAILNEMCVTGGSANTSEPAPVVESQMRTNNNSFVNQAANLLAASQMDAHHHQMQIGDGSILSLSQMQKVDLNGNYLDSQAGSTWHGYEYLFNHHSGHPHYLSQLNNKHLLGYQHQQQQQQPPAPAYNSAVTINAPFFDMNMNIENLNMVQMVHHHHHHHMSHHHHLNQIGSGAASCFHPYQTPVDVQHQQQQPQHHQQAP